MGTGWRSALVVILLGIALGLLALGGAILVIAWLGSKGVSIL